MLDNDIFDKEAKETDNHDSESQHVLTLEEVQKLMRARDLERDSEFQKLLSNNDGEIEGLKRIVRKLNSDHARHRMMERSQDRHSTNTDDESKSNISMPLLPHDVFSFIAFSRIKSAAMFSIVASFSIQVAILSFVCVGVFSTGSQNNLIGIRK
jgi:hypothetical protein